MTTEESLKGLPDLMNDCIRKHINIAMSECSLLAQREAVRNAPRSPTMAQARKLIATRRKLRKKKEYTKADWNRFKKRRKANATSRAKPGGLERSISEETNKATGNISEASASIFVSQSSEASKYAKVIHDEKGKRWKKRGAGTMMKGSRADDKFIERAIVENDDKFQAKFERAIQRGINDCIYQFGK